MKFGEYIRVCRERYGLTQSALVDLLYGFHDIFNGLDMVTLSRWERNVTAPNIERQRYFIEAMQEFEPRIFPAFDAIDMAEIEAAIFERGIQRTIGKHKRFILNFPSQIIEEDALQVEPLTLWEEPEPVLKIAHTFIHKVTQNQTDIPMERFAAWVAHPSTLFLVASYHRQFFGMLISLRLKPEIFEKLMHFEMEEKEIVPAHFADENEEGCAYPLSMLAYTEQCATLLALRYYRYLMEREKTTAYVGSRPKLKEGGELAKTLGLSLFQVAPDKSARTFRANINDVLLNRYVLTLIFKESNQIQ